jgi:uncharacterized protein (DUF2225 family)
MKTWFQKYWSMIVISITAIIAFFIFKKNNNLNSRIHFLNQKHKEELSKIEAARIFERRQKEENEKKYKETLESIKLKYLEEKQVLEKNKEKEISAIIKKHGNDPEELALVLSNTTGFKIILPEN